MTVAVAIRVSGDDVLPCVGAAIASSCQVLGGTSKQLGLAPRDPVPTEKGRRFAVPHGGVAVETPMTLSDERGTTCCEKVRHIGLRLKKSPDCLTKHHGAPGPKARLATGRQQLTGAAHPEQFANSGKPLAVRQVPSVGTTDSRTVASMTAALAPKGLVGIA